jgi:dipeptide/tripeptide permease
MSVFHLLNLHVNETHASKAWIGTLGITQVIAGWLADTRIGRYKVVRTSIWIMWIAAVIATTSTVSSYILKSKLPGY